MKTFCRLFYRIPFSETDAMKIVHHSNHARYLERGRVELLRLAGYPYSTLVDRGIHIPVLEVNVAFKRPLVFDEVILIETGISKLTRTRLSFSYRIFSAPDLAPSSLTREPAEGQVKVTGESFHCCVNETGRPIEFEEAVHKRMQELWGEA